MSKDIELPERTDEVIRAGDGSISTKTSIKCGPCMNSRHYDCVGEGCECKRNNHKQ